ncbi:MAG: nucleotidyltransferase family protein [Chloroflexi bacterium]|nr:nucleotidyltransferase family protein [Chloroflexota bacterium]
MTTAAILLAAGESARMGRPKPLLPWGEATLIEYQVQELRAAGVEDIVAVLGHEADAVRPRVPAGARIVVNEAYREGRASSLRAGAKALDDSASPIVVLNVDQPRPRDLLRTLLAAHGEAGAAITLPVYEGKRGHPVIVDGSLLAELRNASEEDRGLRGIIAAHDDDVHEVEVQSSIARLDINTPADYERALAAFGLTGSGLAPEG